LRFTQKKLFVSAFAPLLNEPLKISFVRRNIGKRRRSAMRLTAFIGVAAGLLILISLTDALAKKATKQVAPQLKTQPVPQPVIKGIKPGEVMPAPPGASQPSQTKSPATVTTGPLLIIGSPNPARAPEPFTPKAVTTPPLIVIGTPNR
jgi:hypothetical protein